MMLKIFIYNSEYYNSSYDINFNSDEEITDFISNLKSVPSNFVIDKNSNFIVDEPFFSIYNFHSLNIPYSLIEKHMYENMNRDIPKYNDGFFIIKDNLEILNKYFIEL